jgi:hypothetical protein
MSLYRIVIYGWLLNKQGMRNDYAMVDLTYFVDSAMPIDVADIYRIIEGNSFKLIPKRLGGRDSPIEQDRVQVENWDQNIRNVSIGVEEMGAGMPPTYPPGHSPPF